VSYGPVRVWDVAIEAIATVRADPDVVVYNLLLDGDHTYFADGYLVHNKADRQRGRREELTAAKKRAVRVFRTDAVCKIPPLKFRCRPGTCPRGPWAAHHGKVR